MDATQDPWWIITSAALALHGIPLIDVADVDVLGSERDVQRILLQLDCPIRRGASSPKFRSAVFATWRSPALNVDLMAGFEVRLGGSWRHIAPATRVPITIGDATLFVPDRAELTSMLGWFGRPKDIKRARLLAS
ncbi:hypothetical protein EAH87_04225 [Sphingomonas koreensis]|nr:hypothetical protein EAH87_04225 [Sphingomonas koreensis]